MNRNDIFQVCVQIPTALFWLWALHRKFWSRKPLPWVMVFPARIFMFCLIVLTLGLLAGCANPDPLAVASGPLFPLNPGHWQPTPQDLAAPPVVADK
jgi:hypothetical protein